MLVYRVAYSGLARYSQQQMANPKGKNGETPERSGLAPLVGID